MENKILKFVNENKWFVVSFLVWSFIHFILFLTSEGESSYGARGFWPFNKKLIINAYGFLELFVYLTLPILIFVIFKLVGKDIKKGIDGNN